MGVCVYICKRRQLWEACPLQENTDQPKNTQSVYTQSRHIIYEPPGPHEWKDINPCPMGGQKCPNKANNTQAQTDTTAERKDLQLPDIVQQFLMNRRQQRVNQQGRKLCVRPF